MKGGEKNGNEKNRIHDVLPEGRPSGNTAKEDELNDLIVQVAVPQEFYRQLIGNEKDGSGKD